MTATNYDGHGNDMRRERKPRSSASLTLLHLFVSLRSLHRNLPLMNLNSTSAINELFWLHG